MIPFNFKYYRPDSLEGTIKLYKDLSSQGLKVLYYGGGTEFISMARMNNVYADAVIDYKNIPECNELGIEDNSLIIGSAVTLTKINESGLFPLLGLTCSRIADHTIQNKISLGGNIAGTIIYRETVLPLLVTDSEVEIAGKKGIRRVKLNKIFDKRVELKDDELIVRFFIDKKFLKLPSAHVKRTKNEKIDYPLITMVAMETKAGLRFAFSGLCDYPFRSIEIEKIINNESLLLADRLSEISNYLKDEVMTDISGSKEYRKVLLKEMIKRVVEKGLKDD